MPVGLLSNVCDCNNQSTRSVAGIVLDSFWKHDGSLTSLYMIAYGLVAILALVGNFLVVVAVYNTPSMHSSVNILIVNMSVGGILYAMFVLPTSLLQIVYYDWFLGAFMCKATAYIQGVVVTSVIYTLIAIAIDRYIAICGKLHANSMNKQNTLAVMLVIWLLAGALMTPFALNYEAVHYPVEPPVTLCRNHWRYFNIYFASVVFIANYTIPLCLISFCYASIAFKVWKRDKEFGTNRHIGKETQSSGQSTENTWRVVKMMIMIVVLFAFSWLPLYTTRMIMMVASSNETSDAAPTQSNDSGASPVGSNQSAEAAISLTEVGESEYDQRAYWQINVLNDVLVPLSQWLSSSNCCMNPWVYCFFSPKYRRAFKRIVIYRFFGKVCSAAGADSLECDGHCKTTQSHCTKCKRPCELRGTHRHRCERAANRPSNYSRQSSGDSLAEADACSPMRKTSVEFIALQTHQENLDTPDENLPQSAKNSVRGAPYAAVQSAECTRPLPGLIDVEIMPRKCAN